MTKVEKVKKLMERYGLSLDDLKDVEDDEEKEENTDPKVETKPEDTKVEETKETEKVPEGDVETKKEDANVEETTFDIKALLESFKQQSEEIKTLKETLSAQSAKVDKSYEMLSALGEKVDGEEDEELGLEFQKKFGGNYSNNMNDAGKDQNEFAKLLNDGHDVR